MPLPRLQLFELEDLGWFPRLIRDFATDYLHFVETLLGLHEPVTEQVRAALAAGGTGEWVDLCSGGGGPVLALYESLTHSGSCVRLTLTDKYPNLEAFALLSARHPGKVGYVAGPVDATAVPAELKGLRTMFNAFHHFDPAAARSVLRSAVAAGQPIGIFEISHRTVGMMAGVFFTPVFVWAVTPWLRPLRWDRLLLTYVLPLIPLTCWWDGVVSQWRAYSAEEMVEMTEGLGDFRWETGCAKLRWGVARVTYLVGVPLG